MELTIDPQRLNRGTFSVPEIMVRAKAPDGHYLSVDISDLDRASLLTWLRSRGGSNQWAENTVLLLLGHEALDEY